MTTRLQWIVHSLKKKLWFRAGLFGLFSMATAALAAATSPFFPDEMSDLISSKAIEDLLTIIASSMLAVVTFSLGTMVAAFSSAAANATPRASKLMVEDTTSQNTLSTFIGAFIFSLVALIVLSTGYYGPGGRLVLFVMTVTMIIVVIVTMFRWIDYLSNFGRMSQTIGRVEKAALQSVRIRCASPALGAHSSSDFTSTGVEKAIFADEIGYLQHLDVAQLQEAAERADGEVCVLKIPGAFISPDDPIVLVRGQFTNDLGELIKRAFFVAPERTFEQDPRFGLIVLSEIASRALSPSVNDPGTAIDVLGRLLRVLRTWAENEAPCEPRCVRVYIPLLDLADRVRRRLHSDSA